MLTGAALGVTAYSRALGKKLEAAEGEPVEGGTEPSPTTSPDIAKVQRRLKVCQWLVPGLTAGLHVLNALHGEQQRPQQQLPGILAKPAQLLGLAGTAAVGTPARAQRGRSALPPRRAGGAGSAGRRSTGDLRAGRQGAAEAASGARPAHHDAAVADRDDDGLEQRRAGDRGQLEWVSGGVPVGHLASACVRAAPTYSSRLTAAPAHMVTACTASIPT